MIPSISQLTSGLSFAFSLLRGRPFDLIKSLIDFFPKLASISRYLREVKHLQTIGNPIITPMGFKFIGNFFMKPNYLTDILSKSSKKIGIIKKVSQKKTDKKKN